jgi:DNA-binding response OmpR family regulator
LEEFLAILVVEDDQSIQSLVEDTLSDGGFEPAIAPSGEEAVTLLQGHKGKYRALVIDIGLRGRMDGWEVAQHIRATDPELPVVYMSGNSFADWPSKGVPNSIMLVKPFAPAQLVTAVSQLLNTDAPTIRRIQETSQLSPSWRVRKGAQMSRYFFDVTDDGEPGSPDEIGTEFPDNKSIPDEAVDLLVNIARERLPYGTHRTFGVGVRDHEGRVIFKATLAFQAGWQSSVNSQSDND